MKESLQTLKALLDAQQNQPRQSTILLTPPSSRPGSASKQMVNYFLIFLNYFFS